MGLLQLPVGSGWVCDCNSDDPKRIWPCVRKESFTRELGPAFRGFEGPGGLSEDAGDKVLFISRQFMLVVSFSFLVFSGPVLGAEWLNPTPLFAQVLRSEADIAKRSEKQLPVQAGFAIIVHAHWRDKGPACKSQ